MSNIYVHTQSVNNICKDATCRRAQSARGEADSPTPKGGGLVPGCPLSFYKYKKIKKFFSPLPNSPSLTYPNISNTFLFSITLYENLILLNKFIYLTIFNPKHLEIVKRCCIFVL